MISPYPLLRNTNLNDKNYVPSLFAQNIIETAVGTSVINGQRSGLEGSEKEKWRLKRRSGEEEMSRCQSSSLDGDAALSERSKPLISLASRRAAYLPPSSAFSMTDMTATVSCEHRGSQGRGEAASEAHQTQRQRRSRGAVRARVAARRAEVARHGRRRAIGAHCRDCRCAQTVATALPR